MKKNQINPSLLSLVFANSIPLWGVLFLGWDVFLILVLYWAENLIIGFYNILRMLYARKEGASSHLKKLYLIPFFVLHYGAFIAGHGFIILALFSGSKSLFPQEGQWVFPLIFLQLLINVVKNLYMIIPYSMFLPLSAMVISHGITFVSKYILKKKYLSTDPRQLMNWPYPKIIFMHITIIAGAFLLMLMNSPVALIVALVVVKTIIDVKPEFIEGGRRSAPEYLKHRYYYEE